MTDTGSSETVHKNTKHKNQTVSVVLMHPGKIYLHPLLLTFVFSFYICLHKVAESCRTFVRKVFSVLKSAGFLSVLYPHIDACFDKSSALMLFRCLNLMIFIVFGLLLGLLCLCRGSGIIYLLIQKFLKKIVAQLHHAGK